LATVQPQLFSSLFPSQLPQPSRRDITWLAHLRAPVLPAGSWSGADTHSGFFVILLGRSPDCDTVARHQRRHHPLTPQQSSSNISTGWDSFPPFNSCLFVFLAVAHWLFCFVLRVVPGTVWSLFSCSARLAHGDPPPLNPKPPSHRINHKRLTTGRLRTVFVNSTSPRSRLLTSIHHQRHSSSQADAFLEGGLCSTQQTNPPCSAGPGIDVADTIQTHALSSFVSTTYPRTEVDS
jgi:hypothetical protein